MKNTWSTFNKVENKVSKENGSFAMRILLVYPEMPDTYYSMKHYNRIIGKKSALPPLGLLTVSAMLPEGWERKLVDLNVNSLSDKDLQWADYIFISAMNVQEESVRQVVEQCKKNKKKIVAGGPLFTNEYERFDGIDHFVLNEAEITLPLFIADLLSGNPLPIYKSKEFADITTTPVPDLKLVDMNLYITGILQYSRGCPFKCDFCDVTSLYGRRPRTKSTEQIIRELKEINNNSSVDSVFFADDNLIGNKKILKSELLPALIKWRNESKPSFTFTTQVTINIADDEELMQLMLDAGFRNIFIGIETSQEDSLKISHKIQNMKRNLLETIHMLHGKGFIVSAGFVIGFDTDNEASFTNQINFIQASGIPFSIVNVLKAPPGTELFERLKKENRLSSHFTFNEAETNILPVMGKAVLYTGFQKMIDKIYPYEYSYERIKTFFKNKGIPKTNIDIKTKKSFSKYLLILNIVYKLGIRDRNRHYFWKLIIWTFFENRKFLIDAIISGITMYQLNESYKILSAKVKDLVLAESAKND